MFELARELKRDCIELADWPLCKVLLMNDCQFPWFILVPRVEGVREIIDLNEAQLTLYYQESKQLQLLMKDVFSPYKLNVAALGNMVSNYMCIILRVLKKMSLGLSLFGGRTQQNRIPMRKYFSWLNC